MYQRISYLKTILFSGSLIFGLMLSVNAPAAVTYTLTVETTPPDSVVRIMNIKQKYRAGMVLPPGTYDVYVTRPGYKPERRSVVLGGPPPLPGQSRLVSGTSSTLVKIELKKEGENSAVTYTLTVDANPPDSQVRIMNIKPKYRPGMELPPGTYDILVTKPGYHPERESVTLGGPPLRPGQPRLASGTSETTVEINLIKKASP